jgi:hypothetical protein
MSWLRTVVRGWQKYLRANVQTCKLLGQNKLSVTGSPQAVQLTVVLNLYLAHGAKQCLTGHRVYRDSSFGIDTIRRRFNNVFGLQFRTHIRIVMYCNANYSHLQALKQAT